MADHWCVSLVLHDAADEPTGAKLYLFDTSSERAARSVARRLNEQCRFDDRFVVETVGGNFDPSRVS